MGVLERFLAGDPLFDKPLHVLLLFSVSFLSGLAFGSSAAASAAVGGMLAPISGIDGLRSGIAIIEILDRLAHQLFVVGVETLDYEAAGWAKMLRGFVHFHV